MPYVVWYNDQCATAPDERLDGVAINNEAWRDVSCVGDPDAERDYLDRLQAIADLASLQESGELATHYSIGWHWSRCGGVPFELEWEGTTQPPTWHMIDIFDSVDVQAAFVSASTVAERAVGAGYAHAVAEGKPFYVTSFANKVSDDACTTTHFPYYCQYTWSNPRRTDDYMMQSIFDTFAANGIPQAIPTIHHFRGVYSTGGHPDWPSYYSGSVASCTPPIHGDGFHNPGNRDEFSWPAQSGATRYQVARADSAGFDTGCSLFAPTSATSVVDSASPVSSAVFYYLVRTVAPGSGSWGYTSDWTPRSGSCL